MQLQVEEFLRLTGDTVNTARLGIPTSGFVEAESCIESDLRTPSFSKWSVIDAAYPAPDVCGS